MHDELRSCLDRGLLVGRPVEPYEHKAAQMTPICTRVEQDPVGDTLALAQKPEEEMVRGDLAVVERIGLPHPQVEHLPGARRERELIGEASLPWPTI